MKKLEKESVKQFDLWAKFHQVFYLPFLFLNKKIVRILDPHKNSSILDIGCGWGILLKQLSLLNRNLQLYGIDISPHMVKVAKSKFISTDTIEIREGSANKLPYRDNSFDYITCILSFHHHPNSLNSLKEMYRVLKPDGQLFLYDTVLNGFIAQFMIAINRIIFREKDIHHYSSEQMSNMFKKIGFVNIQQKSYNFYHLLTKGGKKYF